MSPKPRAIQPTHVRSIGILGFGAFGRLIAAHLHPYFSLFACDPALTAEDQRHDHVRFGNVCDIARCDLVILAVPIGDLSSALREIRPHLRPGGIVVDVSSVKVRPIALMKAELPPFVDIVGTHPLFGPQSASHGIVGRKIALCPVRGSSAPRIAAFLRHALKLAVYIVSPEEHDRQAAIVQGITHLVAKVLVRMEPLPTRLATASFDHLIRATEMVRYDAASVFLAIERENPYAAEVREQFFLIAEATRAELDQRD
ncbi:MAG TPA: prephenate dehydrogenase [Bradyrhizobium sp.]|jgi:prephenate dehydrogenase|uniref:prephenate dehydrogenase n=1 Tax=Bradyrhizobium sp. TaxID=376 RepID=UPI002CE77B0A|nr:prephenate dehydrogenase [Bradyrhizobium sp.]HXB76066.1 prephenate dehydrogenase [Bradyrhizobium sp.]